MSQGESGALPQKEPSPPLPAVTTVQFYPDEGFPLCDGYMVGPDDGKSALYPTRAEAIAAYLSSPSHDDSRTDGRRVEQVAGDETP